MSRMPHAEDYDGPELVKGHIYRIRSRNLPYGVYDGRTFIGIREKWGDLFLSTEAASAIMDDLGPVPEGTEIRERLGDDSRNTLPNKPLYEALAAVEAKYGRGTGYGGRPGDPPDKTWRELEGET